MKEIRKDKTKVRRKREGKTKFGKKEGKTKFGKKEGKTNKKETIFVCLHFKNIKIQQMAL